MFARKVMELKLQVFGSFFTMIFFGNNLRSYVVKMSTQTFKTKFK
ncbi:hypothetical protein M5D96_003961, partial [Drosophila gunungcola]